MAIISMLPSGLRDPNRSFPETTINLKSNKWIEVNGRYKYTEVIDGLMDSDVIGYKLSNTSPAEDELYVLANISDFTYGINHIVFTCEIKPTINVNMKLYPISYSTKELYKVVNRLENMLNAATINDIPNTLVLRNISGAIPGSISNALNAKFSTNDEYGRNIAGTYAPIASPVFTGTPTVPNPDVSIDGYERVIPNIAYVDSKINTEISKLNFMNFIGTLGIDGDVTELPREGVNNGDSYKVITAGTYAEYTCNVGDILVAKHTGVAERTNEYWSLIPSADDTPLVRYTTNISEVNISTAYSSGRLSLGEAAIKQITTSIDNTTNLPTAKAVNDALDILEQAVTPDYDTIPLIGTKTGSNSITIEDGAEGAISIESITPNANYTSTIIDGVTLSITLNTGDRIIRAKSNKNLTHNIKTGEWYKQSSDSTIERLSDDDQIKLANICMVTTFTTIVGNGLDFTLKYPMNDIGAYVLNSYNAPQKIMMSMDGADLYIKNK